MRMLFEDGQLTAEAKRAGIKVGDTAGKTMSGRIKASLGPAIATGIGTVLGAGFAIAAKGAAELDAATRQFQADTGATAEEATKASHAIAGMYRDNLQGFDQISAALSKVHTDLGLTGTEAEKTAALFLKFGTATGQDAAAAVAEADDTLDAFNLTAADAGPLLDKLVVSHQKWGGSISENQVALHKLAPALTSFGLGLDDGIGLLNMFQAAGIDASKVPAALNAALKKVKSPEEFKKLLKDIADTKDPFEQAQKAIALFGARAGPQLAQALRQGNLDDFTVSMTEATGATNKASDAIESSFGNQFKMILKNAGGALAEFGNNFGPLLMVAAQLGPKMITGIGAGLGAIAGKLFPGLITKVLPAAFGAGTITGTTMGGAAAVAEVATQGAGVAAGQAAVAAEAGPAAMAAGTAIGRIMGLAAAAAVIAIPIAIAVTTAVIGDKVLEGIKTDIEQKTAEAIKVGSIEGLDARRVELEGRLRIARASHLSGPMLDSLQRQMAEIEHALADQRGELMTGDLGRRGPATRTPTPGEKALVRSATTLSALQVGLHADFQAAVAALRKASDPKAILAAAAQVMKDILGGVGNASQTAALIADLSTKRDAALAAGDKSLAATLTAEIRKISPLVAGRANQAALLAQGAKVVASSESAKQKIADLKTIQAELLSVNRTTAAAAIQKQIETIIAINKIVPAIDRLKPGQTIVLRNGFVVGGTDLPKPPPKPAVAPKTLPGGHPMRAAAFGGAVSALSPTLVGERGPELYVPRASGSILTEAQVPQMGGGNTTINNVAVTGLLRARDTFEVATQLRRLSSFGVLTPRREPA